MLRTLCLAVTMLLAACAPPPSDQPILPISQFSPDSDDSFVFVTLEDKASVVGFYALCPSDGSNHYVVKALTIGLVVCDEPNGGLEFGVQETGSALFRDRYVMSDGSILQVMQLRRTGILNQRFSSPGEFIVAGRTLDVRRPELFAGRTVAHAIRPGTLRYLGHVVGTQPIQWRDPGDLAARLIAEAPRLTAERILVSPPRQLVIGCSGSRFAECKILPSR